MPTSLLTTAILSAVLVVILGGVSCKPLQTNNLRDRLQPSNFRDWSPQFSQLPYAEISPAGQIKLHNIRDNRYLTENDFVTRYIDREFDLDDVQTIDFFVVPFRGFEVMAHTMVSFGLSDGTYISVSAEIRTEKGEAYSPLLGVSHQFELTYVVADERDIVRLRTRHRDADVYLYRTVATAEQSQALFLDMIQRINRLAERPEFYDTLLNNCTTNILKHVNRIRTDKIRYTWQVLLPGMSDRYAYDQGLLDRSLPFDQLKQSSLINDLAERYDDDPDFSQKIRQRLDRRRRVEAASSGAGDGIGL